MRILYVNSGLRYGGAETQLIGLIRELRRIGHEVALYLLTADAPRLAELADIGVSIYQDDKSAKFDAGVLRRLRRAMKDWRPDLVHGFLFDGNLYARVAALGLGLPVLNSERSSGYRLRTLQKLVHWPTRGLASAVVANSSAGVAHAGRLFNFPAARIHLAWNGVDPNALAATAQEPGPDYRREFFGRTDVWLATLAGTLSPAKDHMLALQVAEHLLAQDERWRVLFVGESFGAKLRYGNADAGASSLLAQQVQHRLAGMSHQERINFVGQRKDAVRIIAQSDVLFATSLHEGFPNVVLEAMAVGTPVVSTDYSDILQILPQAWQVVASRQPQAMAAAINQARKQRRDLGQQQLAWLHANATIAMSTQRMLAIYGAYLCKGSAQ